MNTVQPPDRESFLLRKARKGDGAAYSRLVAPYIPSMLRLAGRVVSDDQLARDVVQVALEKLFHGLDKLKDDSRLGGYFAGFVVRVGKTQLRSEWRRKKREQIAANDAPHAAPEQELEASELQLLIRRTLESMPEKRREAVMLRMDAGLSYEDIAPLIDSSVESARVLVHLGLKELKEKVQVWQGENPDAALGRRP